MAAEEISLMRVFWVRKRLPDALRTAPNFQEMLELFIATTNKIPTCGQIWEKGQPQPTGTGLKAFSIKSAQLSVMEEFDIEFELHPFNGDLARRIELGAFTIEPRTFRFRMNNPNVTLVSFDLAEKE